MKQQKKKNKQEEEIRTRQGEKLAQKDPTDEMSRRKWEPLRQPSDHVPS